MRCASRAVRFSALGMEVITAPVTTQFSIGRCRPAATRGCTMTRGITQLCRDSRATQTVSPIAHSRKTASQTNPPTPTRWRVTGLNWVAARPFQLQRDPPAARGGRGEKQQGPHVAAVAGLGGLEEGSESPEVDSAGNEAA